MIDRYTQAQVRKYLKKHSNQRMPKPVMYRMIAGQFGLSVQQVVWIDMQLKTMGGKHA